MEQTELPPNVLPYQLPVVFETLQLPATCLSPVSLELPVGLSLTAWVNLWPALQAVHTAADWWQADWQLYGQNTFGEEAAQGLAQVGSTSRVHAWVAEKFPPERRRINLTWSHHREVAALDMPRAELLLDAAEREQWSVQRLREAVAELHGKTVHRKADRGAAAQYSKSKVGMPWSAADHLAMLLYLGLDDDDAD